MNLINLKNRYFHLLKIAISLSLLIIVGMGCGDADEASPPSLPDYSVPHDAVPKRVIATIQLELGIEPWGIAAAPDGNHVYVANKFDGSVTVIQTADNQPVKTIPIGPGKAQYVGIVVSPDNKFIYVTNYHENSLAVIQTDTAVISTEIDEVIQIDVGRKPASVALTPDGKYIYVANWMDKSISVIQSVDHTVVTEVVKDDDDNDIEIPMEISVGKYPVDLAISSDSKYLYVINEKDNLDVETDIEIDADTVYAIQLFELDESNDFVLDENNNPTFKNEIIQKINVGNGPKSLAITPDGEQIYVTNNIDNTVSVIQAADYSVKTLAPKDTENEIIGVGNTPGGLAITYPEGDFVFVANHDGENGHTISVINTADNGVDGEIDLEDSTTYPQEIAITPDDNVYVTDPKNDTIIVIGY